MGAEGSEGIEGTGVGRTGVVVGGVEGTASGVEEVGAGGSSVGSTTGADPRVEYQQPVGPRPIPEAEDERHGAWFTTDR